MELIGRDRESAVLVERLASHRLVTLVGPGGIGKTALARSVAAAIGHRFELGTRLVDLTRVDAPDAVAGSIAAQLGFPSFTSLLSTPTEQPTLVVVDNCEHVLDAAATAVVELLAACSSPTVLATSRSPLEVPGESLVVLGPLVMPRRGAVDPDAPAVRLFLDRALDAGSPLGEEHWDDVAELCRALDGHPLALELAAARTRLLTPAEILDRLDDLDTLARPRFRGARRHQSLRATIEWSYAQLPVRERTLFDRLGVLAGSFTAATAHAVAAEPGDDERATLELLDGLLAASLLVTDSAAAGTTATTGTTAPTRYRQLHALRTFALERLDAGGNADATWERFVGHVVEDVTTLMSRGRRAWDADTFHTLLDRYDQIDVAVRRCIEHDEGPDRTMFLLAVLWGVLHQAHTEDIAELGERALTRWPAPTSPIWADAVATVATCRFVLGRADDALVLAESALDVAEGAVFAPCTLRRVIGQARWVAGDADGALRAFDEAAERAARRHVHSMALELDVFRALVVAESGRVDEAVDMLRRTRADSIAAGSHVNEAWSLTAEGLVLLRHDPEHAEEVLARAWRRSVQLAYPTCIAESLHGLAIARLLRGDPADAARRLGEVLDDLVARGALTEMRTLLTTVAATLHRADRSSWAEIAATARQLAVVSMFGTPGHELVAPPPTTAAPLPVRAVVALARAELAAVAGDRPDPVAAVVPAPGTAAPNDDAVFAPTGDHWVVTFAGRTVTVKASKGMDDLATLLGAPGREVHCLELVGALAEDRPLDTTIDATARQQYERRLRELQLDIDAAEEANDTGTAERARAEFDAIVDHLTGALGLGGRARSSHGGTAERARSTVTQRIRATIRRLGGVHPELGRHLEASVQTGTYCVYRPEHTPNWRR